jgi:hypothetical protein
MKRIAYSFIALIALVLVLPSLAQKEKKKVGAQTPALAPDPSISVADARARRETPKQYEDSAEFVRTFKEIYPMLKPKGTIRDLAEKQVDRQLQALIKQGADSMEVLKVAYKGLEEDASYKIYFDTYREKLTAKDLKAYLAFLKTPEGAKVQAAAAELSRASGEVTRYVTQTVNTNLTPIRTSVRDKMMKDQKERDEKMKTDTTDAGKQYRQQMHMRDSIMKARGINPSKM